VKPTCHLFQCFETPDTKHCLWCVETPAVMAAWFHHFGVSAAEISVLRHMDRIVFRQLVAPRSKPRTMNGVYNTGHRGASWCFRPLFCSACRPPLLSKLHAVYGRPLFSLMPEMLERIWHLRQLSTCLLQR
jgi:hypothetical protein